jgi:hypothetical protein
MKIATEEEKRHEFVKEYPNLTKDVIFEKILRWIAENFKSPKSVVDYQDKQTGTILAKGIIIRGPIDFGGLINADNFKFTLTVDVREGKARYKFTNILWIASEAEEFEITGQIAHINIHKRLDRLTSEISEAIQKNDNF